MVHNSLLPTGTRPKTVYSSNQYPTQATSSSDIGFKSLVVSPNSNNFFSIEPSFVRFLSESPNIESSRVQTASPSTGGVFRGRTAQGTITAPSGTLANDTALFLDGFGFASDTNGYVRLGNIQITADENVQILHEEVELDFLMFQMERQLQLRV